MSLDVFQQHHPFVLDHIAKIKSVLGRWCRSKVLMVVGIAPDEEVAEGELLNLRLQHACPPCWVGDVLIAALGEGEEFAFLGCEGAEGGEVLV